MFKTFGNHVPTCGANLVLAQLRRGPTPSRYFSLLNDIEARAEIPCPSRARPPVYGLRSRTWGSCIRMGWRQVHPPNPPCLTLTLTLSSHSVQPRASPHSDPGTPFSTNLHSYSSQTQYECIPSASAAYPAVSKTSSHTCYPPPVPAAHTGRGQNEVVSTHAPTTNPQSPTRG